MLVFARCYRKMIFYILEGLLGLILKKYFYNLHGLYLDFFGVYVVMFFRCFFLFFELLWGVI